MMTPNDIDVLLHYHVNPNPHPRIGAHAVRDSINWFVHEGIFKVLSGSLYATTDRGKALVIKLCSVDLPKLAWVDENNTVIIVEE